MCWSLSDSSKQSKELSSTVALRVGYMMPTSASGGDWYVRECLHNSI